MSNDSTLEHILRVARFARKEGYRVLVSIWEVIGFDTSSP